MYNDGFCNALALLPIEVKLRPCGWQDWGTKKDTWRLDLQRRSGGVDGTNFFFTLPPSHTRIFRLRRLLRRTRRE
jgi:hypothetical protein